MRLVVGVLRGGTSSEYDLSLKTGHAMLRALPEDRFDTRDIFIDKRGVWHLRGIPVSPSRALAQIDVVVNGLHGGVGEDGSVHRIVQRFAIPHVSSPPSASALALHKLKARQAFSAIGIKMPRATFVQAGPGVPTADMAQLVFAQFGPPYVVKPLAEGSSIGIRFAPTLRDLARAIGDVLDEYGEALVEEYVIGQEAVVGLVERFRGEDLYALPPSQVVKPAGAKIVEYAHRDQGSLRYIVPSDFSFEQKRELMDAARAAHQILGLSHASESDFIVARHGVYLLEINPTPGLYRGAAFPPMLEAIGSSVGDFLEHSIALARERR